MGYLVIPIYDLLVISEPWIGNQFWRVIFWCELLLQTVGKVQTPTANLVGNISGQDNSIRTTLKPRFFT